MCPQDSLQSSANRSLHLNLFYKGCIRLACKKAYSKQTRPYCISHGHILNRYMENICPDIFDCTFELDLIVRKSPFDCGKKNSSLKKGTYDMQLVMLTSIAMFVSVDDSIPLR